MLESNVTLITIALSVVSFLAGFIDSIAGGGGLLMLPALLFAGFPPQTALGTNKFASVFGMSVATFNFARNKMIVWKIVFLGVIFSLLGASVGSKAILFFTNETVGKIIVFLLPVAMVVTLAPKKERGLTKEISANDLYIKVPLIACAIGFYDGFFGPGTGSFLILAFYLLLGLNLVEASGTAKVFNLASGIGALTVFLLGGKVLFLLGLPLAAANIAGSYLGSSLAIKKGSAVIKVFLIVSLSILFVSLVSKYFLT